VLIAESAKTPPLIAVLAPFILSIVFLVLSPLFTKRAQQIVAAQIDRVNRATGATGETVPDAVDPKTISDYIEQAADVIQFLPVTLLPVAGVVFAVSSDITQGTALIVLLITVVALLVVDVWLTTVSAQTYASTKFLKLSLGVWAGVVANGACIVLLVAAS
jgi:hypothetical protein